MEGTEKNSIFSPVMLGPVMLRNRIIKAATFEGMAIDNMVTDALVDFHHAFAEGGIGMTTLAYCAVSPDGQGAPNEIVVREEAVPGLKFFVESMHQLNVAASIQLGHAGPVGMGVGGRALSASKVFSKSRFKNTSPATETELARVIDSFTSAAVLASKSGFDCIELHFGHGYLISNFLSPKLNRRKDNWGGSLENRARLARMIARRVKDAVPNDMAIIAKLNLDDGVKGGFKVDECAEVARMLEADGALDALELTGGSSFENPMYFFRGDVPVHEMAEIFPKGFMRLGFKLTAKKFMPYYPFEEAYFLEQARQVREAVEMPLILLGGINNFETVELALTEGFNFVAMGRALLREPDLVKKWESGIHDEGLCIHCNKCMPSIYQGTHCFLVPHEERPGHGKWPPPTAQKVGIDD
tara:strand:- start:721 stop:1959 length:1239 start_codon:yes stop_codon:yes gene_type:complete